MRKKIIILVILVFTALPSLLHTSFAQEYFKIPDEKALKTMLSDFENYAVQGMKDWKVPGMAIAIVRDKDTIYQMAFGVKTLGKSEPVTVNTIFQIGSTSKAFTAALLAMLVDEGKFKWNDFVVDHLDDFMLYDPWVTRQFMVVDLTAQRSGMPGYAGDTTVVFGFDRQHVRHAMRHIKPKSSFRSEFAYQNNLFLEAAALIEKYTGKSWEENIKDRIFKPLGMNNSSVDVASFQKAKDVITLHNGSGDKISILPMDWTAINWTYTYGPAGGINSNIIDMTKWLRLQFSNGSFEGKQLIKEGSTIFMHSPKTILPPRPGEPSQYYCQGWIYRENYPYPIIWHNGGTSGCKTMVAFIPQAKLGIVVLSNLNETLFPESLAYRFFDMYFGKPARDWSKEELEKAKKAKEEEKEKKPKQPVSPNPPMSLEKYAGSYYNEVYNKINVTRENEGLALTIGPKKIKISLRHWERDTFMASWQLFVEKEDVGFVSFQIGPDSTPTTLTIDVLNNDGCGVFRRVPNK